MSGYPVEVGIDWNGDSFICWDCLESDDLNEYGLFTGDDAFSDHGSGTTTLANVSTEYGLKRFQVVCVASTDSGMNFYNPTGGASAGTLDLNTGDEKTIVVWVQGSDETDTDTLTIEIKLNGGAVVASNTVALTTGVWKQVSVAYTPVAVTDGYVIIRIASPSANGNFYMTGLMEFTNLVGSVPTGYNTGATTDYLEALTTINRVVSVKIRAGARPYKYIADQTRAEVVLDNYDRLFSPEFDIGDLYNLLVPKRLAAIRQEVDTTNLTHYLFTGFVEPITPDTLRHGSQYVQITMTSIKQFLDVKPCKGTYYSNQRVDQIIIDQLQHYDSSIDTSAIGTAQTTVESYGDNLRNTSRLQRPKIYEVLADVVRQERGWLWINAEGQVEFFDRHFYYSVSSSAAFNDTFVDAEYIPFAERLINTQRIKYHPRRTGSGADDVLYECDESIIIDPGQTIIVELLYTDTADNPIGGDNVVTPTGADYVFTGPAPSVSFTDYAQHAEVSFTNNGSSRTIVTTYTIKGDYVYSRRAGIAVAQESDSVTAYGKREGPPLDFWGITNRQDASSLAHYIVGLGSEERGEINRITLHAKSDGIENETQVTLRLGDLITIQESQTYHGIGGDFTRYYLITGLQHEIENKEHTTRYDLEYAPLEGHFWVLGVSLLGNSTVLGY